MSLVYKLVGNEYKNVYEFIFEFEHGDADLRTHAIVHHAMESDDDVILYLKRVKEVSDKIEAFRDNIAEGDIDEIENLCSISPHIPYSGDHIWENVYFAKMALDSVFYYSGEDNLKYEVINFRKYMK